MSPVEPDLLKAYNQLKQEVIKHRQERVKNESSIRTLTEEVTRKKFYLRQLSETGGDLSTYKGVGKVYVQLPYETIMQKLENATREEQKMADTCLEKKKLLQERVDNVEKEFRELLDSSPALQQMLSSNMDAM